MIHRSPVSASTQSRLDFHIQTCCPVSLSFFNKNFLFCSTGNPIEKRISYCCLQFWGSMTTCRGFETDTVRRTRCVCIALTCCCTHSKIDCHLKSKKESHLSAWQKISNFRSFPELKTDLSWHRVSGHFFQVDDFTNKQRTALMSQNRRSTWKIFIWQKNFQWE